MAADGGALGDAELIVQAKLEAAQGRGLQLGRLTAQMRGGGKPVGVCLKRVRLLFVMSSTINPHLVPQFYLRYFSSNRDAQMDKNQRRIHTFSKRRGRAVYDNHRREGEAPRPPLISKVATAKEFYEPYGQGDVLEQRFNRLESEAKKAIDEILQSKSADRLSKKRRSRFSEYVALQYYRTLKYRRFLENDARVMRETIYTDPTSERSQTVFAQQDRAFDGALKSRQASLDRRYAEAQALPLPARDKAIAEVDAKKKDFDDSVAWMNELHGRYKNALEDEDLRQRMHEDSKDIRGWQNLLIEKATQALTGIVEGAVWTIGVNASPYPFLTSDTPVMIYPTSEPPEDDLELYHNYLLAQVGLVDFLENPRLYPIYVLYLPLSPEVILQIAPFLRLESGQRHELLMNDENVIEINHYQALQAHDEVFSTTDVLLEPQVRGATYAEHLFRTRLNLWADD